jgi:hypothetical protein
LALINFKKDLYFYISNNYFLRSPQIKEALIHLLLEDNNFINDAFFNTLTEKLLERYPLKSERISQKISFKIGSV